ncbi:DUF185-domain-containing protein [Yamadazyma tenuis ATCC 10573]|uniref:Protein arginine methyltransferase NDUFAF7 n=1 Tax=Candida tenuis (strain ATCC 10573 / BCRC 21748 / CBS 615 / JCM 9827 / NBRC 10315 / NRRL Y-1498 / VKM Y-70) TaxID=590646 RepID=G3BBF2_CANTC|nr:DUF185-domain-containing protein [Yamadazyma tenuis ATCC 10573]EGV62176.1 DUF185-domain-containing protein [Yamadazyma tenuis ATCC 10573]
MLRSSRLIVRRGLFNGNKLAKYNENDTSFNHEYSIRPDTFAFKVSGKQVLYNNRISPFQSLKNSKFNMLDFVYRNSTNYPFAEKTPQEVFNSYPPVNSKKLARNKHRPKKVKMAVGDFIEDSLYNPNYGYFSSEVEIFKSDKPFDYNNIEDVDDFMENWRSAYSKYDQEEVEIKRKELIKPDEKNYANPNSKYASYSLTLYNEEKQKLRPVQKNKRSLQLWHTPTELFQPFYGEALAKSIVHKYKTDAKFSGKNLVIYEMGGGNGTLMVNILNYIKLNEPEIYKTAQYKIIEISSQLAIKQYNQALGSKLVAQNLDASKCEIINKSIFEWSETVQDPVFFIALEVFDNFAHDLIRYDNETGEPHQGYVLVDDKGDFYEFFTPELNYYSESFLQLRENGEQGLLGKKNTIKGRWKGFKSSIPFINKDDIHPLHHSRKKLLWHNTILPFKDNLSPGEFIPTRLLHFFHVLQHRFPNHSLVSSDFNFLPSTVEGYYNGPVVQTVLKDRMIDISTYMCNQGYFDIMFATDFQLASDLYRQVTGKTAQVESHKGFLQKWSDLKATNTKRGENPMLEFYTNVSFMTS